VRLDTTGCSGRGGVSRMGRVVFVNALLTVLFVGALPAWAAITGPASAHVLPGASVGVNMTTDGTIVAINGSHSPIFVVRSGSAPTFRFTFTVPTSTTPGSYGYTFIDDAAGNRPFSLIVDVPATTTTTTQPPPTTTTTRPPTTTTTTRPPTTTTTTRPPTTTTTEPLEETTTSLTTTTTVPQTTTIGPTTTSTTTTLPTTTSTSVPSAIAAPDDGGTSSRIPIGWLGGGSALLILGIGGAFLYSRHRPAYGSATPESLVAWRHLSKHRRAETLNRPSRTSGLSNWWRTSGPLISYREWRSDRNAAKDLQRRIEERRRLGRK